MAGPGGGPPRKSHTKSRKGCKTCKRRHIRCDESFPQCRNCTKHNCRCDYMDSPPPPEDTRKSSLAGPDLLWTPPIEREVELWQRTGVFPFFELNLEASGHFRSLSLIDRRLIHHLSSIYSDMQRKDFVHCTLWVELLPSFLDASVGHDFVMSSILAFSATHLAWHTRSVETKNLAYYHRGVALKGLHGAIGNFSKENSDPILAASILLSWQASDWGGWTSLMRGISTVVSSMSQWKGQSRFFSYIEGHPAFFSRTSLNPSPLSFDDESLLLATGTLQRLSARLSKTHPLFRRLKEILEFTKEIQSCSATMQSDQLFEKLQPLRAWLFWMPVALIWQASGNEIDSSEMILLAQLYTIALAIDSSIPELGGAALGSLTVSPTRQIDNKIRYSPNSRGSSAVDSSDLDEMMQFSRLLIARCRLEDPLGQDSRPAPIRGPHSPYGFQNLAIGSQPSTPSFAPGTPGGISPGTPGFSGTFTAMASHSLEDLSVPASPFLRYSTPISRPHSQLLEASPRLSEASLENPSNSTYSVKGESPAYSPRYLDDESVFTFGGNSPGYSPGYSGGEYHYDDSSHKGKKRRSEGLTRWADCL